MSAKIYPVLKSAKSRTLLDNATYLKWYEESVSDPAKFWGKHGKRIDWFSRSSINIKQYRRILECGHWHCR